MSHARGRRGSGGEHKKLVHSATGRVNTPGHDRRGATTKGRKKGKKRGAGSKRLRGTILEWWWGR